MDHVAIAVMTRKARQGSSPDYPSDQDLFSDFSMENPVRAANGESWSALRTVPVELKAVGLEPYVFSCRY